MSSIWSDDQRRNTYYSDGITRVTDPFWTNTCHKCGHAYVLENALFVGVSKLIDGWVTCHISK